MVKLGNLLTAMVTPFSQSGDVDYERARQFARALIKSGSDGLVIGGTTGEAPSMDDEERLRLFKEIKEEVGNEAAVIAGTTDNNTRHSINLSRKAEEIGADAILMTVPAYNKPTQQGLYLHFKAISENISIPGILYNVPSRTAVNMTSDTTLKLAQIPNITGVKEASGMLDQITEIIRDAPKDFLVWSGNDNETFPIMAAGGFGVVSVASNIIGRQIKNMINLLLKGELKAAATEHKRLLPIFNALFWITNPIPVRYALNRFGFSVGPPRLPMVEPSENFKKDFDKVAEKYVMDILNV